jgi:hypothetical protein
MPKEPSPEDIQQIADALASGRKIEAIKMYREATGVGLAEAKEFVEALIPKLKEQDPPRYANLADGKGSGCASMILVGVSLGAGAAAGIVTLLS